MYRLPCRGKGRNVGDRGLRDRCQRLVRKEPLMAVTSTLESDQPREDVICNERTRAILEEQISLFLIDIQPDAADAAGPAC